MYRCCGERKMELKGRIISKVIAKAEAVVTSQPISFYGGVNPDTGMIIEKGHELEGKNINGKIFFMVFC